VAVLTKNEIVFADIFSPNPLSEITKSWKINSIKNSINHRETK